MGYRIERRNAAENCSGLATVTPDDNNDLAIFSNWIYVGVTGNLVVTSINNNTVTISNAPVGWHPIAVKRILATGTTATNLVVAY